MTRARADGIFIAPFEQGEIGRDLFHAACRRGLEGLLSKRRDRPYQAGRSSEATYFRFWHISEIARCPLRVRFRGQS
jgi:hypothetical protein